MGDGECRRLVRAAKTGVGEGRPGRGRGRRTENGRM